MFGWAFFFLAPGNVDLHFLAPNLAYMQYFSYHPGFGWKMSDFTAMRGAIA
jgi:hypothetical protein